MVQIRRVIMSFVKTVLKVLVLQAYIINTQSCDRKCIFHYVDSFDGGWSEWIAEDICSASCGQGTVPRKRSCTNPAPSGRGDDCQGPSEDVYPCTMEACPGWTQFSIMLS